MTCLRILNYLDSSTGEIGCGTEDDDVNSRLMAKRFSAPQSSAVQRLSSDLDSPENGRQAGCPIDWLAHRFRFGFIAIDGGRIPTHRAGGRATEISGGHARRGLPSRYLQLDTETCASADTFRAISSSSLEPSNPPADNRATIDSQHYDQRPRLAVPRSLVMAGPPSSSRRGSPFRGPLVSYQLLPTSRSM